MKLTVYIFLTFFAFMDFHQHSKAAILDLPSAEDFESHRRVKRQDEAAEEPAPAEEGPTEAEPAPEGGGESSASEAPIEVTASEPTTGNEVDTGAGAGGKGMEKEVEYMKRFKEYPIRVCIKAGKLCSSSFQCCSGFCAIDNKCKDKH